MENQLSKSNIQELQNYLAGRKLKPFGGSFFFKSPVMINNQLVKDFVVVSYNLNRVSPVITKIDNRTNDGWSIVYNNPDAISIWGIHKLSTNINKVVITESVLDAESFNQYTNNKEWLAIATSRASFTLAQFHYLIYLAHYFDFSLYIAFDNDESGKVATERFVKKAKYDYNMIVSEISYPYKDFNDFLSHNTQQFKMFVNNEKILFRR